MSPKSSGNLESGCVGASNILVAAHLPVLPRSSACITCRRRKVRCQGEKPECVRCMNTGRECRYEDLTFQTRTEKLLERIMELESRLEVARSHAAPGSDQGGSSGESLVDYLHPGFSPVDASTVSSAASPPETYLFQYTSPICLRSPDGSSELLPPLGIVKKLIDVFALRHAQCGFELHINRVVTEPSSASPKPVIHALFNAMLLMACHFTQDNDAKPWENIFLIRTKQAIDDNIDKAYTCQNDYNSIHHLQAMSMLGQYYYIKGRLLEGHVHCASATQFALALGLHRLGSYDYTSESVRRGLWKPKEPLELGEAINLWWNCLVNEFGGSNMNGLPNFVHEFDITAVWPRLLDDFENNRTFTAELPSAATLLDIDTADVSQDNVKSSIAKACMLMNQASRLDTERLANLQGGDDWWIRFEDCDRAVFRSTQTMPPIQIARNVEELACLVFIQTSIYCANVQLHSAIAEIEVTLGAQGDPRYIQPDGSLGGPSYIRCAEACRATGLAAQLIANVDLTYMHMLTGLAWVCVSQVLIKDISRLRQSGWLNRALEKQDQLAIVERSMERLIVTYPVFGLQVQQLAKMKTW